MFNVKWWAGSIPKLKFANWHIPTIMNPPLYCYNKSVLEIEYRILFFAEPQLCVSLFDRHIWVSFSFSLYILFIWYEELSLFRFILFSSLLSSFSSLFLFFIPFWQEVKYAKIYRPPFTYSIPSQTKIFFCFEFNLMDHHTYLYGSNSILE